MHAPERQPTPRASWWHIPLAGLLVLAILYGVLFLGAFLVAHLPPFNLERYPLWTSVPFALIFLLLVGYGIFKLIQRDLYPHLVPDRTNNPARPSYHFAVWAGMGLFTAQMLTAAKYVSNGDAFWICIVPAFYWPLDKGIRWLLARPRWSGKVAAFERIYRRFALGHGHLAPATIATCGTILLALLGNVGLIVHAAPTFWPAYTYRGQAGPIEDLAWSPDDKRIASADVNGAIHLWDALTGAHPLILSCVPSSGYYDVYDLSWSPDGTRVAANCDGITTDIWDASTGKLLLQHTGIAACSEATCLSTAYAWSPDDARIVETGGGGRLYIWNARTGQGEMSYESPIENPTLVAWSPNGQRIVTGDDSGLLGMLSASSGKSLATRTTDLRHQGELMWSPDSSRIAISGSLPLDTPVIQVWDASLSRAQVTLRLSGFSQAVGSWSPDGRYMVVANGDDFVQVWSVPSATEVFTWRGHSNSVDVVAWSPRGSYIASGDFLGLVQVWRPQLS